MKLATICGQFMMASRPPFNLDNMWDDPRGMTGTEVTFVYLSEVMAKAGHDVTAFTKSKHGVVNGVKYVPMEEVHGEFDIAVSFCEPDYFKNYPKLAKKRVVVQEVNDFSYVAPDAFDKVDQYISISENHMEHMRATVPQVPKDNWKVIYNPVDPARYEKPVHPRSYGRVIYCSSPDRGLHRLLEVWPQIRAQEPTATLRIFYDMNSWLTRMLTQQHTHPILKKLQHRAIYINSVLPELMKHGVSVHQAVSRPQIAQEMMEASVFGYTCDPITYTEGFSCATLEACAAGTWPVITDADALPSLYGSVATVIPRSKIKTDYADAVVAAIRNDGDRSKLKEFAKKFDLSYLEKAWSSLFTELVT